MKENKEPGNKRKYLTKLAVRSREIVCPWVRGAQQSATHGKKLSFNKETTVCEQTFVLNLCSHGIFMLSVWCIRNTTNLMKVRLCTWSVSHSVQHKNTVTFLIIHLRLLEYKLEFSFSDVLILITLPRTIKENCSLFPAIVTRILSLWQQVDVCSYPARRRVMGKKRIKSIKR